MQKIMTINRTIAVFYEKKYITDLNFSAPNKASDWKQWNSYQNEDDNVEFDKDIKRCQHFRNFPWN